MDGEYCSGSTTSLYMICVNIATLPGVTKLIAISHSSGRHGEPNDMAYSTCTVVVMPHCHRITDGHPRASQCCDSAELHPPLYPGAIRSRHYFQAAPRKNPLRYLRLSPALQHPARLKDICHRPLSPPKGSLEVPRDTDSIRHTEMSGMP